MSSGGKLLPGIMNSDRLRVNDTCTLFTVPSDCAPDVKTRSVTDNAVGLSIAPTICEDTTSPSFHGAATARSSIIIASMYKAPSVVTLCVHAVNDLFVEDF